MAETQWKELIERLEAMLLRIEPRLPAPVTARPEGPHRAWRWSLQRGFVPVPEPRFVAADELLWIEEQSAVLVANAARFMAGQPANHALLWGARGTGKSSLIRSLPSRFDQLALVEVEADELRHLPDLLGALATDPRRFIVFADDLSFDAGDPSYTALKALLDGSVAGTPDNVLIHASSNRRHLMPEAASDNLAAHFEDGELHPGEAVEEKISLSERFGVWLAFHPFSQDQYLACVRHWLARLGAPADAEVENEALQWALRRGSRNGRVARQFAISRLR